MTPDVGPLSSISVATVWRNRWHHAQLAHLGLDQVLLHAKLDLSIPVDRTARHVPVSLLCGTAT